MARVPDGLPEKMLSFRALNDMTQKQFAEVCKVAAQTIGNIEGKRRDTATTLTLRKIEKVLNGGTVGEGQ